MSRVELARRAGVNYATLYAIETGTRRLTDTVAQQLATTLDTDVAAVRQAIDITTRGPDHPS